MYYSLSEESSSIQMPIVGVNPAYDLVTARLKQDNLEESGRISTQAFTPEYVDIDELNIKQTTGKAAESDYEVVN